MNDLDECERLIRELKILDSKDKIMRVTMCCPSFAKYEVWYQTYRAAYSEAYFSQWSYNVGPCLYDYVIRKAITAAAVFLFFFSTFEQSPRTITFDLALDSPSR